MRYGWRSKGWHCLGLPDDAVSPRASLVAGESGQAPMLGTRLRNHRAGKAGLSNRAELSNGGK